MSLCRVQLGRLRRGRARFRRARQDTTVDHSNRRFSARSDRVEGRTPARRRRSDEQTRSAGRAANKRPLSANAATLLAWSVAYAVMPPPLSRVRSRRARSSGGRSPSSSVASSIRGSPTNRSIPDATSSTHSAFTESEPLALRRKITRSPSADTVMSRGAPSVNRCVLACWRGKVSSASIVPSEGVVVTAPTLRSGRLRPLTFDQGVK